MEKKQKWVNQNQVCNIRLYKTIDFTLFYFILVAENYMAVGS